VQHYTVRLRDTEGTQEASSTERPSNWIFLMNEPYVLVIDMRVTKRVSKRVEELVLANRCIGELPNGDPCPKQSTAEKPIRLSRGVCDCCRKRLEKSAVGLTRIQWAKYESRLIAAGHLLSRGQAARIKNSNVFNRTADAVRSA
jgi:hypothetical protein